MKVLRAIIREVAGLFVDDGSFAFAIVVWVLVDSLLVKVGLAPALGAVLLCAGLAAIMAENVWRSSRRARDGSSQ